LRLLSRRLVRDGAAATALAAIAVTGVVALMSDDSRFQAQGSRPRATATTPVGLWPSARGSRATAKARARSREGRSATQDTSEVNEREDVPGPPRGPGSAGRDAPAGPGTREKLGVTATTPAAESDEEKKKKAAAASAKTTTVEGEKEKSDELPPGIGLAGEYWDVDHSITRLPPMDEPATSVRLDPAIDFPADKWNLPFRRGETWATRWRGYFLAKSAGKYTFVLGSDDGAVLELDNAKVCGEDRLQSYTELSGAIELGKGLHPLRLRYFNNQGPGVAILRYVPPEGAPEPVVVPTELLYPPTGPAEANRPVVRSAKPPRARAGDTITLEGQGFAPTPGANTVTFGPDRVKALVTRASERELSVVIPEAVDGGPLAVVVDGQTSAGIDYEVGGFFGLHSRTWRPVPTNADVVDFRDPTGAPDDERLVGPIDLHGSGFGFAFPSQRFASRLEGRLYARDPGDHELGIESDDGGRLFVDGRLVASAPGLHPKTRATGHVLLVQGWHDVAIDYFQNRGGADLVLLRAPPEGTLEVCPRALLAPPPAIARLQAPYVSDVAPRTAATGDRVRISGDALESPGFEPRVLVDGQPLTVLAAAPGTVLVEVPPNVSSGQLVVKVGPFQSAPVAFEVTGHGLKAEYWRFPDGPFVMPAFVVPPDHARNDPNVDFAEDAAFKLPFEPDHFAARWTGDLVAPVDGTYELVVGADDGMRLRVDGRVVVEDDSLHAYREQVGSAVLNAGRHSLELTFFQNEGAARCRLLWTVPGAKRAVVPSGALVPAR
jgi:hypothetical protein